MSKRSPFRDRENNIKECFNGNIDFKYQNSLEDFDTCLDIFQRRKEKTDSCYNNFMKENILDRLIVMDDVSGLADKS